MRRLWKATLSLTEWNRNKQKPYGIFLTLHTILWMIPGLLISGICCLILGSTWYDTVTAIVIAAGLPAMAIGFFGGALFLMRLE